MSELTQKISPNQIRSELLDIVRKDLRGPANGTEEIITEQTVCGSCMSRWVGR